MESSFTTQMTAALGDEKVWALHQDVDGGSVDRHARPWALSLSQWPALPLHHRQRTGQRQHLLHSGRQAGPLLVQRPLRRDAVEPRRTGCPGQRPQQPLSLRIFRANEGGKPAQFYGGTQPAGALTSSGEAWFPTSQGLWSIRPDELEHPLISNLNIDTVTVDGRPAPLDRKTESGCGQQARLEIGYEPVLLRSQEGLRFRYRLDGYDRSWTYANAQQRLATYTNLPAGQYTFLVEAWETDHPGHAARASIAFAKRPYFYRTPWFIALCALLVALLSVLAYQVRMKRIHDRFKAVLAERTRLAREMHDTLIQGCVSISALLEAASSGEIDDNESRLHLIDYAATQIRSTVDEARQAVWNLRGEEHAIVDLETALQRMAERIGREHDVEMVYRLTGKPFALSLPATHELMMVAREAVFNAILHGHAKHLEAEICYAADSLSLTVKDDGQGFDAAKAFTEGHFGLRGMQERIHRFDGKLRNRRARPTQGTRVLVRDSPRRHRPMMRMTEYAILPGSIIGLLMPPIRILIVDDHPIMRVGITALIASCKEMETVAQAGSGEEALKLHALHQPGHHPDGFAAAGHQRRGDHSPHSQPELPRRGSSSSPLMRATKTSFRPWRPAQPATWSRACPRRCWSTR